MAEEVKVPSISEVLTEVGTALSKTQRELEKEAYAGANAYHQNIAEAEVEIKTVFKVTGSETQKKLGMMLINGYTKYKYDLSENISSMLRVKFVATTVENPPVNLDEDNVDHVVGKSDVYKEVLKRHKEVKINKTYLSGQRRWLVELENQTDKTKVATLFVNDRNGELEK